MFCIRGSTGYSGPIMPAPNTCLNIFASFSAQSSRKWFSLCLSWMRISRVNGGYAYWLRSAIVRS